MKHIKSQKQNTKPRANLAELEKCKKLFMDYVPISQIAQVVGIPRSTISYHAKKDWQVERDLVKAQLFQSLTDSKKVDFTRMTQSAITIMGKALQAMSVRPDPPTLREAQMAADVLNTLDKITRLDEGSATDIVANQEKAMTIETVQQKIALDPFAIKTVGYKEIEENNEGEENEEDTKSTKE